MNAEDQIDDEPEVIDADPDAEAEPEQAEQAEQDADPDVNDAADDAEVMTVQIGDDAPEEGEDTFTDADGKKRALPDWVRELRAASREKDRKIKELERRAGERDAKPEQKLRPKPTLADHDYDEAAHEADLDAWYGEKREADAANERRKADQEAQTKAWNDKLSAYTVKKRELPVQDFDDVEAVILDTLNVTQQGIIVQGAKNPALLIYALGKNPKKLKELAAMTDPIQFAFAAAQLEGEVKVTKRKPETRPERQIGGGAGTGGAIDNRLDKLRDEAQRTGDYSKVIEYKRKKRAA